MRESKLKRKPRKSDFQAAEAVAERRSVKRVCYVWWEPAQN